MRLAAEQNPYPDGAGLASASSVGGSWVAWQRREPIAATSARRRRRVPHVAVATPATLKARSTEGAMAPLGSVMTFRTAAGPDRAPRDDLCPTAKLQGDTRLGISSGEGLAAT